MKHNDVIPYKYLKYINENTPKLLEYLYYDLVSKDEADELIEAGLKIMEDKYDCSDFRACVFIRVLYNYSDRLSKHAKERIIDVFSKFPFIETSGNSMCTWTENHQLLFASTLYLFTYLYNKDLCGMSYLDARKYSYDILDSWANNVIKFGFSEFYSNNYYPLTLAGIGNVIEFTEDDNLRNKYKVVLDLMLLDLFSTTTKDFSYVKANARSYVDNKVNHKNYMLRYFNALTLNGKLNFEETGGCFNLMLQAKDKNGNPFYKLPLVFKEIYDLEEKEVRQNDGLEIKDYKKNNLLKYSEENARYALASGALSDYRVISNAIRYFDDKNMWNNSMLQSLRILNKKFLYRTPLLKLIKSFIPIKEDGMAYGSSNCYTYVKNNYSLSCLAKYHVGKTSFQQVPSIININGLTIFTNVPSKEMDKTKSPDYWIGSKVNPHVECDKNTMLSIFKLKKNEYTHTFVDIDKFDESNIDYIDKGFVFLRKDNINVMIKTNSNIRFIDSTNDKSLYQDQKMDDFKSNRYDLVNKDKGSHYYIYKICDECSFDDFINKMLKSNIVFNKNKLVFNEYKLKYNKCLYKNNEPLRNRFNRFESSFTNIVDNKIIVKLNKHSLIIDLDNYRREEV